MSNNALTANTTPQATPCQAKARERLLRIITDHAKRRGIHLDGRIGLHGGHWWVCGHGTWIRTTDLLQMEVLP